jgi:hypothetical protein
MFKNAIACKLAAAVFALFAIAGGNAATAAVIPVGAGYHVTLDTSAFSGAGWLDLSFIPGQLPAAGLNAYFSNFSGALGSIVEQSGETGGSLSGGLTFGNHTTYNDHLQQITLGGLFSFDLAFFAVIPATTGTSGTNFNIDLLRPDFGYLGNPNGHVAEWSLTPPNGASHDWGIASRVYDARFATVGPNVATAVPEPGTLLLMSISLAALGLTIARKPG